MQLVFKMCSFSFTTSSKPANSPSVLTVNGYHISGTPLHQLDSGHMSLRKASGDPQVSSGIQEQMGLHFISSGICPEQEIMRCLLLDQIDLLHLE